MYCFSLRSDFLTLEEKENVVNVITVALIAVFL